MPRHERRRLRGLPRFRVAPERVLDSRTEGGPAIGPALLLCCDVLWRVSTQSMRTQNFSVPVR
jgi:hypothetical protein